MMDMLVAMERLRPLPGLNLTEGLNQATARLWSEVDTNLAAEHTRLAAHAGVQAERRSD